MTREEAISKLYELIECTIDRGMIDDICYEIIEFLEAQDPRVMTLEEINKRAESLDPDPIFVQWRETGGTAWIVGSINIIAGMVNAGNRNVRAWTSRPSPEQMRDTPWEDTQ